MACKCYHADKNFLGKIGVCWGTKECEACSCGGDESKCDFYDYVRERNCAAEQMDQYISRNSAIQAIGDIHPLDYNGNAIMRRIRAIPLANVVPAKYGTWINADEQPYFRKHYHTKVCSECGKRKEGKWLYCPYCGSKNRDGGNAR